MSSNLHPPTSRVEMRFTARNLANKDTLSKSDPLLVLYQKSPKGLMELGRTETISDNLNPEWTRAIMVDYTFEIDQTFVAYVVDIDNDTASVTDDDFLGQVSFSMSEVMAAPMQKSEFSLLTKNNKLAKGTLTVMGEEASIVKTVSTVTFEGKKLPKKDGWGPFKSASDPYYEIAKLREDGTWVPVHRSEYVKDKVDVTWQPAKIPLRKLCNGDVDRPLKITVMDWDSDGSHDFIGSCEMVARNIIEADPPVQWQLKDSNKDAGTLHLVNQMTTTPPSFLDYLVGGCEIQLTAAVDFTGSNGDPRVPGTLHYINPAAMNSYQMALSAVGTILMKYDTDKQVPLFGFGGKLPGTATASHCFALNGNPQQPFTLGVEGMLSAYSQAIQNVGLSGPTCFSPFLNTVLQTLRQKMSSGTQFYEIVLILTDGVINDQAQTVDALVAMSSMPVSVVIVGVGNADFSGMRFLDADDTKLTSSSGREAVRDIVQFVPFNQFANSADALTAEVLREIPDQMVEHFTANNIMPMPPRQ
eukprot:GFYU01004751.1.p1 GENE.GFYU01004751.1~~GFYU01004751.1.p1  ORF type:complete len:528 (-),score=159.44 GFYU01004751.1:146-1729(-)